MSYDVFLSLQVADMDRAEVTTPSSLSDCRIHSGAQPSLNLGPGGCTENLPLWCRMCFLGFRGNEVAHLAESIRRLMHSTEKPQSSLRLAKIEPGDL
jgi:hypothetical protein